MVQDNISCRKACEIIATQEGSGRTPASLRKLCSRYKTMEKDDLRYGDNRCLLTLIEEMKVIENINSAWEKKEPLTRSEVCSMVTSMLQERENGKIRSKNSVYNVVARILARHDIDERMCPSLAAGIPIKKILVKREDWAQFLEQVSCSYGIQGQ